MIEPYRSAIGIIPDDAFENEPGPPSRPALSPEALAAFDAQTRELATAAALGRAGRQQ
jgi:hypothetical protein